MSTIVDAVGNLHQTANGHFAGHVHEEADPGLLGTPIEQPDPEPADTRCTVPSWAVAEAEERIAKANRRLRRAGIEQRFEATWSEPYLVSETGPGGIEVKHEMRDLELNHPVLCYAGWEFAAALDEVGDGMVVRTRPGVDLEGYRPEAQWCDHCGTRRRRNTTYLVRHEDGTIMQVGSDCMADFLGVKPAGLWAIGYDPISDGDPDGPHWGTGPGASEGILDTRLVLAAALVASRDGRDYRPSSFEDSTAEQVRDILWGHGGTSEAQAARGLARQMASDLANDPGRVDDILASVEAMRPGSDYADNLKVLVAAGEVRYKHAGIVASAVKVWAKQQQAAQAEQLKPRREGFLADLSTPLRTLKTKDGRPGVAVEVERVFYGTSWDAYGREHPTTTLIMRTEEGQTLKWRSSSGLDVDRGARLRLTGGTVKDHDSYDGHDQTVLTRVKFEYEPDPVEPAAAN